MKNGEIIYKTMCNYAKLNGKKIGQVEKELGKPKGYLSRLKNNEALTLKDVKNMRAYIGLEISIDSFISVEQFVNDLKQKEAKEIQTQIAKLQEQLKNYE